MEDYLRNDYDVLDGLEAGCITCEDEIEAYFQDDYQDYFDCGVGYYEDKSEVIVKIADKFYLVTLNAEITGFWQEYSDKVFNVTGLNEVKWVEIPKPEPKLRRITSYTMYLTYAEQTKVESFFSENGLEIER